MGRVEETVVRSSSRCQEQVRGAPDWVFLQIEDGERPHGKPRSELMGLVCWRSEHYFLHGRSAWIEVDHKGWKDYPNVNCGYWVVDEAHRRSS